MLGLDRLAALKKKEKEESGEEPGSKRSKIHSYKDDDEYADSTPRQDKYLKDRDNDANKNNRDNRNERNYREKNYQTEDKTPTPHRSHHDKISRDKHNRDQRGALYASSNKYRDDRKKKSWEEETPDRRTHRDYDYTPNDRRLKDTPSRSNWEDEESGHRKSASSRSNWDITPKPGRNSDYNQSHRSSRSKYDTPLPTPVHKHNKWAGKNSGDTTRKNADEYEMDEEEQRVSFKFIYLFIVIVGVALVSTN